MEDEEKYWCENCCNFGQPGMDGLAVCALSGTWAFCQEYGGDCIGFNRPAKELRDLIGKNTIYSGG